MYICIIVVFFCQEIVNSPRRYDHDNKRPRGFGFVTFATEEGVDEVFTGGALQTLHDKPIEIKRAVPRDQIASARGRTPFNHNQQVLPLQMQVIVWPWYRLHGMLLQGRIHLSARAQHLPLIRIWLSKEPRRLHDAAHILRPECVAGALGECGIRVCSCCNGSSFPRWRHFCLLLIAQPQLRHARLTGKAPDHLWDNIFSLGDSQNPVCKDWTAWKRGEALAQ